MPSMTAGGRPGLATARLLELVWSSWTLPTRTRPESFRGVSDNGVEPCPRLDAGTAFGARLPPLARPLDR